MQTVITPNAAHSTITLRHLIPQDHQANETRQSTSHGAPSAIEVIACSTSVNP